MAKEIILSIGLLASNRKETIQKSITSLEQLRAKVPCELIVTDTGCDEELRADLDSVADKINSFEWCNDFAAARNANLSMADGKWYLYLDDDEWFDDTTEIEDFFLSGAYLKYQCANYIQRNYKRYDGAAYNDCWVSRMIRLNGNVRFAGKIHEYLTPESTDCRLLHSYVHHYGYIYENEEALRQHFHRNAKLLLQMIEEEPETFRWRTHLAKEYVGVKEWEKLDQLGRDGIALTNRITGTESDIMRGTFYMCRIQSAYERMQYEEAAAVCEEALRDKHNTRLCIAAVFWWIARTQMCLFEFGNARKNIREYQKLEKELRKDPQALALQKLAPMVCLCLDEDFCQEALQIEKDADEQIRKLKEIALIKQNARKRKPVLSITILMSNRKDTAQKCLDSLTTLRKAVPCELLITDTGCDASLRRLIDQYADGVNEFTWCNDFSAARNQGLMLSKGNWYMFLDDDEWFEDTREIVDFFKKGYCNQFDHAYYIQRNYSDFEGSSYNDSYVLRILKKTPDMHFEGKIHEYLLPEKKKGLALHSAVAHYGYVYKNEEDARKHYERNRYLLEEMIAEEPYTLRWRTHLANEYISGKNYDELYALGVDGVHILDKPELIKETGNYDIQLGTFYAAQIIALYEQQKYDDAENVCQVALRDTRNTKLCRGYLYYKLAELCVVKKDYQNCICYLEHYLNLYHQLTQNEASFIAQKTAHIVGSAFEDELVQRGYWLLVISAVETQDDEVLRMYLSNVKLTDEQYEGYSKILIKRLLSSESETISADLLLDLVDRIHDQDLLWNDFCEQICAQEGASDPVNAKIMEILQESGVYLEFDQYRKWFAARERMTHGDYPVRFQKAWRDFEDYYESCAQYMSARKGEQYMDTHVETLSTDCIAALLIREAIQHKDQDVTAFCEALRQCAAVYPPFANVVDHLLKLKELEELKVKVLEQVEEHLQRNQYQEAIVILKELKKAIPNDLQIASMALEARIKYLG